MKLIRRSMAHIARQRGAPMEEVEMQLGHRKYDSVSEIYAPFDPEYLAGVTAITAAIIDEIETFVPGAFHRNDTEDGAETISIEREKILSFNGFGWWARQGLNLRPLRCQHSALPLSYAPTQAALHRRGPKA